MHRYWMLGMFALVFPGVVGAGKNASPVEAAKAQFRELFEAVAKGRAETALKRTHPKVVEFVGKETFLAGLRAAPKIPMKLNEVGTPTLHPGKKELFVVVPYVVEGVFQGTRVTTRYATIGVSADGGKDWRFVMENSRLNLEGIWKMFPDMPEGLKLPEKVRKKEKLP